MQMSDHAHFWSALERFEDAPALISKEKTISFSDLASRADQIAAQMTEQAGRTGRLLVAIAMAPQIDVIAAYLGALRAGHVVLLSDDSLRQPDNKTVTGFGFDLCVWETASGLEIVPQAGALDTALPLHPDLSLLLSTSGSTGEAKLVRLSAQAVQSNALSIVEYLGITTESRAITTLPLFYSYGMSVLHSQLTAGGALVLSEASVTEPEFWDQARTAQVSSLALVPHQVQLISKSPMADYPVPTLRYVTQAGGRLPTDQVRDMARTGQAAGWDFFVMYGQTEASPRMSYVPPDLLPKAAGTIGRAIPGGTLSIRDDDGKAITQAGQTGELIYSGPNVMMGYALNRDELAQGPQTPELATGDLAEWTEEGLVRIVGRLKRFVKLYGMRISLDQVEVHLADHGIAAHAAGNDTNLVLFTQPDADAERATDLVASLINAPANDIVVHPLDEPPLLPNGKIDYKGLDRLAAEALTARKNTPAAGLRDLREVLAQATRSPSLKDNDSFASLGGDSLGFLHATMAIETRLGYVPEAWERMTIGELMALQPAATPKAQLGMDVIVRVLAISLIVINHSIQGGLNGGTWVLLMTLGLSFFRFQLPALDSQRPWVVLFKMYYPVLPLYFLMLGSLIVIGRAIPPPILTLTANFGPNETAFFFNVNWFISLYAQLVLGLVLVFAIPMVRNRMRAHPFEAACGFFGLSLVLSLGWQGWLGGWFDGIDHNLDSIYRVGSPLTCLPMVAFGAMVALAQNGTHRMILLGAVVINAVIFPTLSVSHFVSLLVGGALLASGWVLTGPLWTGRLARHMASAALFVYLLHPLIIRALQKAGALHEVLGPVLFSILVLVVSYVVSWAALWVFQTLETRAFRWLRRRPDGT